MRRFSSVLVPATVVMLLVGDACGARIRRVANGIFRTGVLAIMLDETTVGPLATKAG